MLIPLHVHSTYSLLTSPMSIDNYVASAKAKGYTHIGLADTNVLYGALEFYRKAKASGLTPHIGMTVAIPSPILGQTVEEWVIYACSYRGYQQLMQLSTYLKTAESVDYETARAFILDPAHHQDWVVILGAQFGVAMNHLKQGNATQALTSVEQLRQIFPADQFYLGVNLDVEEEEFHKAQLLAISEKTGVPLLATPYVEYADTKDYFSDQVMHAIDQGAVIDNPASIQQQVGKAALEREDVYVSRSQALQFQQAFDAMEMLAERLTFAMPEKRRLLPRFPLSDAKDPFTYLTEQASVGLKKRLHQEELPSAYQTRLDDELAIIHKMGFDDYFLIVWDVMRYAHEAKIRTGPGRGSAAGSLVSYALSITDVDPITNHLLFERFLNPERQNMPDIDLDFPDNKRNQIVDYVYHRYGSDHVAQISTFGTFQAKQAIRDVGSVLGADQTLLKQWSQAIPSSHQTLADAFKESSRLKELVNQVPYGRLWLETAQQLEGLPRHVSTHAAGVIISDAPLTDYVPLQRSNHFDIFQSQMTKKDVEGVGLLKMDFLSLSNLTILDDAVLAAEKIAHHALEPLQFDRHDPAVYEVFANADTLGIFQFESAGIRNVLRRVQPTSIEDVAAVNALYRPGPMKQIDHFVRRKHGLEPITYLDDSLAPILKETYGIMLYQEQVMQVAQVVAGFSLAQADILRRAMSNKDQAEMTRLNTLFISGANQRGYKTETAQTIFNYIAEFADYGFNKSHAYAYAYLAYQLAWLKVHYPTAFYYGNAKNVQTFDKRGVRLLKEAELRKVKLKAPDVRRSFDRLTIKDEWTLQLGIGNIRGVARALSYAIVTEREQEGQYKDLLDFVWRLPKRYVKSELLLPLVKAGALDTFGYTRRSLAEEGLANICEYVTMFRPATSDQTTLPLSDSYANYAMEYQPVIPDRAEYSPAQLVQGEVETLGQAVKTKRYQAFTPYYRSGQLTYLEDVVPDQKMVQVIGEIAMLKRITTKKNTPMAFLTLRDESGEIEVTLFSGDYIRFAGVVHEGESVYLVGRPQVRHQRLQLIASLVKPLGEDVERTLERALTQQQVTEERQASHSFKQSAKNAEKINQHDLSAEGVHLDERAEKNETMAHEKNKKTAPLNQVPHGYHIRVASRSVASEKKAELLATLAQFPGDLPVYFEMVQEHEGDWLPKRFCFSTDETVLTKLKTIYGNENVRKW
ncbi:MAG: DNA polymerase III subunit alpha [Aerococcus sp.]|nr:DNA polymerase III subunit alpha [Aerococcus sp.]